MKSFSAVVTVAFVLLALFGVFIFATFTASRGETIGTVEVWGALPTSIVDKVFGHIRDARSDFANVTYRQYPEEELVPALVEAIAAGRGPDLIFFPASAMVKDGEKLSSMPYSDIPKRDFQDAFVEAGEVFLRPDGVAALPIVIDPLVLYWNRTMFSNAGIPTPPRFWDDVGAAAQRLTQKTANGSITVSGVALGGWDNIANAKDILITLARQLGSPIVVQDDNGKYFASLTDTSTDGVQPAVSAIRYYVDFADPVKPVYSWNRSQKNSREAFLQGTLAMYIGPASDLLPLRAANPNLNFDVAALPTARGAGSGVVARVTGVAIPRGSPNPVGAGIVAALLAAPAEQAIFAEELNLPSPRRDVNPDSSADAYQSVFRASALRSFVFLDPDTRQSDDVFGRMIENIASGRVVLSQAVFDAQDELQVLFGM